MSRHERPQIAPQDALGQIPSAPGPSRAKMTQKQAALLRNLCDKAGAAFDPTLTWRQANARITTLRYELGID